MFEIGSNLGILLGVGVFFVAAATCLVVDSLMTHRQVMKYGRPPATPPRCSQCGRDYTNYRLAAPNAEYLKEHPDFLKNHPEFAP
jgi:hypothetical protein